MVQTASSAGARLNDVAADLTEAVDQDGLRRPEGGLDLAVLADMSGPVRQASTELRRAQDQLEAADSAWLVGPVSDGLAEFERELSRTQASADTAELAVERVPSLLGSDGPQRYLMLLGNPAEARDLGGHLGNWAEIRVDQGRFDLVEVGAPYDLFSPNTAPPPTMTPGAYPQSLVELRPQYFPQNWGGTADMPTVARLAAELYPQARPGPPLDGVVYADPTAFAALLQLAGPVPVPGTGITLTSDNAVDFLTKGQFAALPDNGPGSRTLDDVIRTAIARFTSAELPAPRRLASVFGPVVDHGGLQFVSFDPKDTPLLERVGLYGPAARSGDEDLLSVVSRNANPSKIDAYLERTIDYDVSWNPSTGRTHARVTVRLTNSVPEGALPPVVVQTPPGVPPGTNRTQLSVLSPLSAPTATIDGVRAGIGTQQEYAGVKRHTVLLDIPPGATRVVTMDLDGTVGSGRYVLKWVGQPLVRSGDLQVSIRSSGLPLPEDVVERTLPADEDRTLRIPGPTS
jgi:hypothetical protein